MPVVFLIGVCTETLLLVKNFKTSLEESITTSSQRTTVVIEEAIKSHTHELIVAPLVVKLQEQLNNAHSLKEQVKSMTTRMSIYLIFNHDSPLPCLLN